MVCIPLILYFSERIMKKTLCITLIISMVFCLALPCFAANGEDPLVYVSICHGTICLANAEVALSDADLDGSLTINDALMLAHREYYSGGADGYQSATGDWGLYITRLWGDISGNYGYFVNNSSALSLSDTLDDGDRLTAYVYTDITTWSDLYSYFDKSSVQAVKGEEITLTLMGMGYDSNFATVTYPVSNAVITINGERTQYITDEEGKVGIIFDTEGDFVIGAKSDSVTLVSPVCTASVGKNTQTGDSTAFIIIGALLILFAMGYLSSCRKQYEK